MRRIDRSKKPQYLEENEDRLTEEYLQSKAIGKETKPYSHIKIKASVANDTYGKCAYCEASIAGTAYGEVEHILPKRAFPHLVVAWDNLTWACPNCNRSKSDYHSDVSPVIDPTSEDPEEFLFYQGPVICAIQGNARGAATIDVLNLRREPHLIDVMRAIESLHRLVRVWENANDDLKVVLTDQIRDAVAEDRPFCVALRSYLAGLGFELA